MKCPNSNNFSIMANISWEESKGIPPHLVTASSKGRIGKIQARKVYSRPRIRLDEEDRIYILNAAHSQENGGVYIINNGLLGKKIKLPLQAGDETEQQILDFGSENDQLILLETFIKNNVRYNRLTALSFEGTLLWSRIGKHTPNHSIAASSLDGAFQKLIILKEKVLLVSTNGASQFVRINLKTGEFLNPLSTTPSEQLQVFSNHKNELVRIVFLSDERRYGLAINTDNCINDSIIVGDTEVYSALQSAYDIDDDLNIYTNHSGTQNIISAGARITYTDNLIDLAYDEDTNSLYALRCQDGKLNVTQVMSNEVIRKLDLELSDELQPCSKYRLVRTENQEIHVHTGEHNMDAGSVIVFSSQGKQLSQYKFEPNNTTPLGALSLYTEWRVTRHGAIILPLTTEKGFVIVNWQPPGHPL